MLRLAGILAALLLTVGCTTAPTTAVPAHPEPMVESPWVRTTTDAKDTTMTAAFMTIVNPGSADIRLLAADCADAGMIQVHEMVQQDGTLVMREARDGVVVPAGSHVHLTPGGYHIMLMQLKRPLPVGDEVALTLRFSDGSSLAVSAPVKEFVEEEDHYHSPTPGQTPSRP